MRFAWSVWTVVGLAQDEVAPFVKTAVEGSQFFVVDVIIHFLFCRVFEWKPSGLGFPLSSRWKRIAPVA